MQPELHEGSSSEEILCHVWVWGGSEGFVQIQAQEDEKSKSKKAQSFVKKSSHKEVQRVVYEGSKISKIGLIFAENRIGKKDCLDYQP